MLTCNWSTKVITVPVSDLTLVSGSQYRLTVAMYAQLLRGLNGSEEGIAFTIHAPLYNYTKPTTGTPAICDVINGYTVEFEDGAYSVEFISGNTNYRDVEVRNSVSVGTNNVSGFNTVAIGSVVTPQDIIDIANANRLEMDQSSKILKLLRNKRVTDPVTGKQTIFDDDNLTKLFEGNLWENVGETIPYQGNGANVADRMDDI